jgi:hypothetical protein
VGFGAVLAGAAFLLWRSRCGAGDPPQEFVERERSLATDVTLRLYTTGDLRVVEENAHLALAPSFTLAYRSFRSHTVYANVVAIDASGASQAIAIDPAGLAPSTRELPLVSFRAASKVAGPMRIRVTIRENAESEGGPPSADTREWIVILESDAGTRL